MDSGQEFTAPATMTWKEKLICRILLIIAKMVTDDDTIREELRHLGNYIQVSRFYD